MYRIFVNRFHIQSIESHGLRQKCQKRDPHLQHNVLILMLATYLYNKTCNR